MVDYWVADYGVEPTEADEGEDIDFWWKINTYPESGASDYLYVYVDGNSVGSTPLYFDQDPGTQEKYTITWSTSSGDQGTYDVYEGGDIEAYTGDNDYMEGITITIEECWTTNWRKVATFGSSWAGTSGSSRPDNYAGDAVRSTIQTRSSPSKDTTFTNDADYDIFISIDVELTVADSESTAEIALEIYDPDAESWITVARAYLRAGTNDVYENYQQLSAIVPGGWQWRYAETVDAAYASTSLGNEVRYELLTKTPR